MNSPTICENGTARPLVSVIIPTHNRATMLREAIDSVYGQEGKGKLFDLEVIVIDDASTDSTPEVACAYADLHYFRLESNKGASGARNVGIRASSGKYVAFLDDDDYFLPHRLRIQVPLLEAQEDLGVVYGQSRVIRGGEVTSEVWPEAAPSGEVFSAFLTLTDDFINITSIIARKELFDKAGFFDESLPTMEHYDMFLRVAFHARWQFLNGPVAVGRFSTQGKWFANVAKRNNERVLPYIIEKALALLLDIPEHQELKEKARTAVCVTIANQRWTNGGLQDVRDHLMATLRRYPWMLHREPIADQLRTIALEIGRTSPTPLADVSKFADELYDLCPHQGFKAWLWKQRVFGELLAEASIGCRKKSPRLAVGAVILSIMRNPYQAVALGKRTISWMHAHRSVQAG